jgi:hypothetical protein
MKVAGACPLGKLLGLSSGSPARTRGTAHLMVFGVPFMTFTRHDLQE